MILLVVFFQNLPDLQKVELPEIKNYALNYVLAATPTIYQINQENLVEIEATSSENQQNYYTIEFLCSYLQDTKPLEYRKTEFCDSY